MPKILVTGGTGYIGSHTIVDLIENGFEVISVDNFCNSSASSLDGIEKITGIRIKNYAIDLCDSEKTKSIFQEHKNIEGIIHFAALKAVGESVEQPVRYFKNNLISLLNVVQCCQEFLIPNLIFSSSCTVYGSPDRLPVSELTPVKEAESPYGRTKQMSEQLLEDCFRQIPTTQSIALRYFNPAGAHPSALLGESPINPALNLVPVITETAIGKRPRMIVHGNDYDTRDGSCVRDYIHIMDLASAHTKALKYLMTGKQEIHFDIFNLGIGKGATVLEAINAFEKMTSQKLNYAIGPRRAGDIEAIYSNFDKAQKLLNWFPRYNIEDIMHSAWEWEKVRSTIGHDK